MDATTPLGEAVPDRTVLRLTGPDTLAFLQGLVTNDVLPLGRAPGIVWAALLSPQGKYLVDFFVVRRAGDPADTVLLDLPATAAPATLSRLQMYRLRAAVGIETADLSVARGLGPVPADALPDPRHPGLGWRRYGAPGGATVTGWDALRVAHLVPEHGQDLIPDDSYILEMGFERLHGVDFRKGCYVGQEVTARMKHKTDLKKGLVAVSLDGPAPTGTEITAEGKPAGRLGTRAGDRALAWLRLDRAEGLMLAGETRVRLAG